MCEPFTIASTALAIGSAVAGAVSQNSAARRNAENAQTAFQQDVGSLQQRGVQIQQQTSEDILTTNLEEARARALAAARGGEAGVSTVTLNDIIQGVSASGGRRRDITIANRNAAIAQNNAEIGAAGIAARSRVAQVQAPSLIATALQIGGIAASSAANYRQTNRNAEDRGGNN